MSPAAPRSFFTAGVRQFIPLLVICAGVYAYHNSLHGPFIFDDLPAISNNPTIRQLWSLRSIMSPPPGLIGRPIVSLSLAVNYAWGGLDVRGYHAFNLAIHLMAGLALYGVVWRTLRGLGDRYRDEAPWLALAITLIWIVPVLSAGALLRDPRRRVSAAPPLVYGGDRLDSIGNGQ